MELDKRTLNASPFVGVFGILTDDILLIPYGVSKKEFKNLNKITNTKVIKASIASSALLGVLGIGRGNKIALAEIARDEEIKKLEKQGLKTTRIQGVTALGNLVTVTSRGGVVSPVLSKKQTNQLEKFFEIKMVKSKIAELDLVGASLVVNSNGFIVNPKVTKEEFKRIKKALKVKGVPTTANYGDRFVGNSVLANSNGIIVGHNTTGHELIRIEEALYE